MDYDFSKISMETITKTEKKLNSIRKNFNKELDIALDFLGEKLSSDQRNQLDQEIGDLWRVEVDRQVALLTECLNKIHRVLINYL